MTVPPGNAAALDTAFFRRWLDRATEVITEHAAYLTELDSAIGDADHGANLKRGFTSAQAVVAAAEPTTPGALLTVFGTHLTSTVGGASGPLYGTVLRRAGRTLGDEAAVGPEALGEALSAAVAGVQRLGNSGPGDKTMIDALAPAAEAYAAALAGGARVADALAAAAQAAREGAEATVPMLARRGRASYLGERSIGHKDPGAASSALLIAALYEALAEQGSRAETTREAGVVPAAEPSAAAAQGDPMARAGAQAPVPPQGAEPGAVSETGAADGGLVPSPTAAAPRGSTADGQGRVGVVLVSHSREVAEATADMARALVGTGDPAPIAAAGGGDDGGLGTSAMLIRTAVKRVDAGRGVVVLCDMGSAVLTVKALQAETGAGALPPDVRIANSPFVEGAVAALVTASTGAGLDAVLAAADDARRYRKD